MNVQPSVAFQLQPKLNKTNGKVYFVFPFIVLFLIIMYNQIILVNLQKTPYDSDIDIRVFAKTGIVKYAIAVVESFTFSLLDEFMKIFMEELGNPEFDQSTDLKPKWDDREKAIDQQAMLGVKTKVFDKHF